MVSRTRSANTQKQHRKNSHTLEEMNPVEEGKKMTQDMIEYMADYARDKPGTAALWCLGVGFVLGWKMKPW